MLARKDLQDFSICRASRDQSGKTRRHEYFAAFQGSRRFSKPVRHDWHGVCFYIATVEEWDGGRGRSQAGA
jgi:hypothetical protein